MCKYAICLFLIGMFVSSSCSEDEKAGQPGEPEKVTPVLFADFESVEEAPYYFRFGNKGSQKYEDYLPRWRYAYNVVENPIVSEENKSTGVLEYVSMEAQDYGIKFRFSTPVSVKDLKGIRLKIYQPENVIGKTVWKDGVKATQQKIAVKLLARVNTVNDFRQESGQLLFDAVQDFTQTGKWITYTFAFSEASYPLAEAQLPDGVQGLAVLPTYGAGVTLAEENMFTCYMDDIEILK